MNRRTFLKRGLMGGAVLLLGGGGLALIPTKEQGAPTHALSVLEPRSFHVMVAIAKRVAPPNADSIQIAEGVDALLRRAPVEVQRDFNKLAGLFENALPGLIFDGRVLPFTRLSPEGQDAVLAHWRDSRLAIRRTGYDALRRICLAVAYADDSMWPAIGYVPPPVGAYTAMAYDDSKMGVSS